MHTRAKILRPLDFQQVLNLRPGAGRRFETRLIPLRSSILRPAGVYHRYMRAIALLIPSMRPRPTPARQSTYSVNEHRHSTFHSGHHNRSHGALRNSRPGSAQMGSGCGTVAPESWSKTHSPCDRAIHQSCGNLGDTAGACYSTFHRTLDPCTS